MKNILIVIVYFIAYQDSIQAQQTPLFSQNSKYQFVSNPATDHIDNQIFDFDMNQYFSASFRSQWGGLEDSPITALVRYDHRFNEQNMIAGISLIADKTGPTSFSGVYLKYAYQMQLVGGDLSIGLGAGFIQRRFKGDESYLRDANDAIGLASRTNSFIDFSLGVYLQSEVGSADLLYAGLSIPQITNINISDEEDGDYHEYDNSAHYQASAGYMKYIAALSDGLHNSYLEPYTQFNYTINSPLKTTFGLRLQLKSLFWVGMGYSISTDKSIYNSDDVQFEAGVILGALSDNESLFRIGFAMTKYVIRNISQFGSAQEINLSYSF